MEKLAARYPQDKEAAIFYALALTSRRPDGQDLRKQLKAASILEPIFSSSPDHPGVAHYLIHSYDYPPIAEKGLPAARTLRRHRAGCGARAAHAVAHLHARRRVGRLAGHEQRSARDASRTRPASMLHALDYKVYGALQLARDAEARRSHGAHDRPTGSHQRVTSPTRSPRCRRASRRARRLEEAATLEPMRPHLPTPWP